MITLGSLFDGAGTFPFAAQQYGVKTLWSSEIEPFPLKVTEKRFPEVEQLGDITQINGNEIKPVDIITFGSPCQDLSVAGKRAGLDGERSGLFMEAVRIIKEMRGKTNGKYPQFAIWENVPGAFSSNKGEDFRIVLEEFCKIKGSNTVIPQPPKRGGRPAWNDSGLILGDEFSIAWRVLDAQFWGVPQRRRRIFLVADFRGQSAGEILFKREGLSRSFEESRKSWKGITRSLACRSDAKVWDARGNGNGDTCSTVTGDHENSITDYTNVLLTGEDLFNQLETGDKSMTICARNGDYNHIPCIIFNSLQDPVPNEKVAPCLSTGNPNTGQSSLAVAIFDNGDQEQISDIIAMATQQGGAEIMINRCPTITAAAGMSGNNQPVICAALGQATRTGGHIDYDLCGTLRANAGDNQPVLCYVLDGYNNTVVENMTHTIRTAVGVEGTPIVCYALDRASFNQGMNAQFDIGIGEDGIAQTLVAKGPGAVCYGFYPQMKAEKMCFREDVANCLVNGTNPGFHNGVLVLSPLNIDLRRLTPIECGRLQGMPDWWCDDIPHSDTAEYKMWGNGMALPCVMFVMAGVVSVITERLLEELLEDNG